MKILSALTVAALALLALPAHAERLPQPLIDYCDSVGQNATIVAGYRDDGFNEQAVRMMLDRIAAEKQLKDQDFLAEVKTNVALVYHGAGWSMSTPRQIGQGAYERCIDRHAAEPYWRQAELAGAR